MSSDYKTRMRGENNPNFRNISKTCGGCGNAFKSYNKASKYCSRECAGNSEQNIKKLKTISRILRKPRKRKDKGFKQCVICEKQFKIINSKTQSCSRECRNKLHSVRKIRELVPNRVCEHCEKPYHSYTKTRKFCSVKCSLDSGTPQRAGNANVESMKKYGAKKDANHNAIAEYLESKGCFVRDLSGLGFGTPDMLVWVKTAWILVEIKNKKTGYGRRGLNKKQKDWANNWRGGKVYIVCSIEDAELLINQHFDKLECFPKHKNADGTPLRGPVDTVGVDNSEGNY